MTFGIWAFIWVTDYEFAIGFSKVQMTDEIRVHRFTEKSSDRSENLAFGRLLAHCLRLCHQIFQKIQIGRQIRVHRLTETSSDRCEIGYFGRYLRITVITNLPLDLTTFKMPCTN